MPIDLPEGSRVTYVGDGHDGRSLSDRGQLLAKSVRTGHVKWDDGAITLHYLADLALTRAPRTAVVRDEFADSLEVGTLQLTGMRRVLDEEGELGVLNVLASAGHLTGFSGIAEETFAFVQQQIRRDASMHEVIAQLDDDEADGVVRLAAQVLLRDAFAQADE